MLQGEQAKEIVTRVKAEEKEGKRRPKKSTRRMPEQFFQSKKKILWQQRSNLLTPQSARGGNSSSHMRVNKQYSFKDEHVVSLFKLLNKSNKIKLPERWGRRMIPTTVYITRC